MIITADSGSTSIDWRILRRGEPVRRIVSPGVNPVLQGVEAIRGVFAEALRGVEGPGIWVYFYGAGVVSEAAGEKVREALRAVLPGCEVTAGSDLEAAAIALLGGMDGVAAIIGTGSNSGLYLGGRIVRNIPAGGFILGDEGSGAWLGKMLLADCCCPRSWKRLCGRSSRGSTIRRWSAGSTVGRCPLGIWLRSPFS